MVSFEGCIGAGKTSLTNCLSRELGLPKVLEEYDTNPFLPDFYAGKDVGLETEVTFVLQHYSQLKDIVRLGGETWVLADFSIEKDLVYAELNLDEAEFRLFSAVYRYVTDKVGIPEVVIYLDVSPGMMDGRICQRGRPYEVVADARYFRHLNDRVRSFFERESKSRVYFYDGDDLRLELNNNRLRSIAELVVSTVR